MKVARHANYPFARQTTKGLIQSTDKFAHSKNATCSSQNRRWLRRRMAANAMATCCSQSDRFKRRSSRTMTGRCRSWPKTPQDETMLISLKTLVERTAKRQSQPVAPVLAVCAAFAAQPGGVPTGSQKPDVAPTCGSIAGTANAEKERLQANFSRGRSRKRRSRTKPRGRARPAAVTSARRAGSFGDLRGRSKHSKKQPEGVAE